MFHELLVFCFGLQNTNRTFVPTSKALNMLDWALFVVCLLVDTLFLLFSGILTCNCISRTYLVAVYSLNTPSTPCCLFLTAKNIPLGFGVVLRPSKHQPYLCSNFKSSKYVRLSLVCCLFACTYTLVLVFWGILTCNCISRTYLVAVYTLNTPSTPCCLFLTTENVPFIFDAMIWTSKHQPYDFYIFQTSEYVRRYLVCCLFACKYLISVVFKHSIL